MDVLKKLFKEEKDLKERFVEKMVMNIDSIFDAYEYRLSTGSL